jgi:hypothetical protein
MSRHGGLTLIVTASDVLFRLIPWQRRLLSSRSVMRMISDIHNIELSFLCQISKSVPNILWNVRGFLNDNPLQVARSNPAVVVAKVSLQSLLEAHREFGKTTE